MYVVDVPETTTAVCNTKELEEKISTLEKTNEELNNKINQRDAELKICYVNIALLVVVIVLIVLFKIAKKVIRKANR